MCDDDSNSICRECGLCCNGVIFADVQLQPGDNAAKLRSLGLAFATNQKSAIGNRKFKQPCTAFAGCRCNIYSERPQYCRKFECLLLKSVKAGHTEPAAALRIIRKTLRRVKKVERLLHELGDTDETIALSKRFRHLQRQFETSPLNAEASHKFGELTLAVHDLNMLLAEKFYPGPE
ncbi:MAG TPA: YkgJ family cysteine cluster protein [Verrucomicrobiae bacterium]